MINTRKICKKLKVVFISLFDYIYNKYQDIKYISWDCQFWRQDRLISCCFWRRVEDNSNPKNTYDEYINHFRHGSHKDWCLFFPFGRQDCKLCKGGKYHQYYSDEEFKRLDNIREGVKDLGVALHHECHDPLELTQLRLLGAKEKEFIFCWDDIKKVDDNDKKVGSTNEISRLRSFLRNRLYLELNETVPIIKNEDCREITIGSYKLVMVNDPNSRYQNGTDVHLKIGGKTIFEFSACNVNDKINIYMRSENDDVELFRRHYHELSCLKNSLLEQINIYEKEKATQISLGIFWFSILLTIIITFLTNKEISSNMNSNLQLGLIFSGLFGFILLVYYLSNSIRLNEAKDAMYICLGVDVDRRKEIGKEYRYIDAGNRPS